MIDGDLSSLVEIREIDGAGRGYFAKEHDVPHEAGSSSAALVEEGATVLEGYKPIVSVIHDAHEARNCKRCFQPTTVFRARVDSTEDSPADDIRFRPVGFSCENCRRAVLCRHCLLAASARSRLRPSDPPNHASHAVWHSQQECATLANVSKFQKVQPDVEGALLGGSTAYLRLLLQLLRLRAEGRVSSAGKRRDETSLKEALASERKLAAIEELEDHSDDLLDGGELEARMANTIAAARLVAPAAWKANQDDCVRLLGKLYCNSMTIGKVGISASLARVGYWSGIRGCLYMEFGVGLYPKGALFNHSCSPNCAWRTDEHGSLRVAAIRNIYPGEQLCISYIDVLQPKQVRRDLLRDHYFFDCACPRCSRASARNRSPEARKDSGGTLGDRMAKGLENTNDGGDMGGHGGVEEDLVTGGWVCPRRACCRKGRILRPCDGRSCDEDDYTSDDGLEDQESTTPMLPRAPCRLCGGFTDETYFYEWEQVLGGKLTAADADLTHGLVRKGRRKLMDLKAICLRRLVPTHAFTLSVLSRLAVAAAADCDWQALAAAADDALRCMRGLREGIMTSWTDGEHNEHNGEAASSADAIDSENDPTQATAIWEAVLVETRERSVSFIDGKNEDRGHSTDSRRGPKRRRVDQESRERRLASAERAALVLGMSLSDLFREDA